MLPQNGWKIDAEQAGRAIIEIIRQRKLKLWRKVLVSPDEESDYIKWAASWAFHWGRKALDYETKS